MKKNYAVLATEDTDSGFQGMLLENTNPQSGEPQYVFAFRGTEADHPVSNFSQFYKERPHHRGHSLCGYWYGSATDEGCHGLC